MKNSKLGGLVRLALVLVFALGCSVSVWAQSTMEGRITLTLDNWDGRYEVGQTVNIHADVPEAFEAIKEVWVNGLLESSETVLVEAGKYDIFTRHHDEPATVMLKFFNPKSKRRVDFTDIGYCVGLEEFRPGFQKPADFIEWWREQTEVMRQLPIEATITEVAVPEKYAQDYVCYDVMVNCGEGGGIPVRGYMAMPKGADVGSLPICVFTHGSGVKNQNNRSRIEVALRYARQGGGSIAFDLNAHGMPSDQPQEYYDNLHNTVLHNYLNRPIENREDYYFRAMYLRVQRLLDWMCDLPEWDGKRVLIVGGSQGAAQAAAICGLDSRVTHAVLRVSGMMDMGGAQPGRRSGPPQLYELYGPTEEFMKWGPYFDVEFFLQHTDAEIVMECGLVDMSVVPTSIMAGYNIATCPKTLYTYPYRGHHVPKGKYRADWKKKVDDPINKFIREALK